MSAPTLDIHRQFIYTIYVCSCAGRSLNEGHCRSEGRAGRNARGPVIVGACGSGGGTSTSSGGSSTRTIKVAGLGYLAQFADAATGAQARFKRFDDTSEMPGVKIKFTEFAGDKGDPATATSEVRPLVSQEQVFAIVRTCRRSTPDRTLRPGKLYMSGTASTTPAAALRPRRRCGASGPMAALPRATRDPGRDLK